MSERQQSIPDVCPSDKERQRNAEWSGISATDSKQNNLQGQLTIAWSLDEQPRGAHWPVLSGGSLAAWLLA